MIKERSLVGGAAAAAFLASLCRIGPLLFVVLGIGAFGAATYFEKARTVLMGGAVLLLAVAFYWIYFKWGEASCARGETCTTQPSSRTSRIGLWVASLAVLAFALTPYLAGPLAAKIGEKKAAAEPVVQEECCATQKPGATASAPLTRAAGMEIATFKVEGMTCASCETTIKLALERTTGVSRTEVSFDRAEAVVEFDPHKATPEKLRDAINSTGYTVMEGNK